MIFSFKSLISLHRVLKFELNLGVIGIKFERNLVYKFRGKGIVSPALQKFVFLVLHFVLPHFVKMAEVLLYL